MSFALALASTLSLDNNQEASSAKLAEIWQSYRYAEYDARGGYVCDSHQHRWIAQQFEERFGRRAATLRASVRERLEKSVVDAEFVAITICTNIGSGASRRIWATTRFKTYQAELATAEQAFGTGQGAH